jgi:uncharacterized protein YqgV (UPF0045/DUF77 family)
MFISAEISYYPLTEDYLNPVNELIDMLNESGLKIEPGKMSTLITGSYFDVFKLIENSLYVLFEKYPSVFTLKISNSCPV